MSELLQALRTALQQVVQHADDLLDLDPRRFQRIGCLVVDTGFEDHHVEVTVDGAEGRHLVRKNIPGPQRVGERQRRVREETVAEMGECRQRLQLGPDDPLIETLGQALLDLGIAFLYTEDQALDADVVFPDLLVMQKSLDQFRSGLTLKGGDIVGKCPGHPDDDLNVLAVSRREGFRHVMPPPQFLVRKLPYPAPDRNSVVPPGEEAR